VSLCATFGGDLDHKLTLETSRSRHGSVLGDGVAPIAQLAEAADLKSAQCRFESDWGHRKSPACRVFDASCRQEAMCRRVVRWGFRELTTAIEFAL
jgi:hypothetical protein